ncbi:MAG: methyltransferase domain-containing protein [Propionibacteriaceae bacterium]|jgi:ubiquinone/menaquinone biosynthesis C-methylase UbiE|nr:methyltransferase domain-containing protein [Propionibacteriaceae bacterium]
MLAALIVSNTMGFNDYLSRQFGRPTGLGGRVVAAVMSRQNRPLYEKTLRLLAAGDTDLVLDIGCGNGFVLALLAERVKAGLAGIDLSDGMVRATARRCRGLVSEGRLTVERGDAAHLPFPDGSFTKAYSINTVYFWPEVDAAMTEIRRALQPDGVFVNALYSNEFLASRSHTKTGYRLHDPAALIASASGAGFEVERVPLLGGVGYGLVCRVV